YYLYKTTDQFSLITPYLSSRIESGALTHNSILNVSYSAFTGSVGAAWADIASGNSTLGNVQSLFAETLTYDDNGVTKAISVLDGFLFEINDKYSGNLTEYSKDIFGSSAVTDGSVCYATSGDA